MPDIDRTADIKVTAAQGTVRAEIPLAGLASEHWLQLFRSLASKRIQELRAEAENREERTWVIVMLPGALPDHHPESALDAARALIGETTGIEDQFQSGVAQTEAAIRGWWARQQR
jgi:hypothetical protein